MKVVITRYSIILTYNLRAGFSSGITSTIYVPPLSTFKLFATVEAGLCQSCILCRAAA